MIYCDASNTVNFKSVLAKMVIKGSGVFPRGNGSCDHDQPIPRLLVKRSNASVMIVETDSRRSVGVS